MRLKGNSFGCEFTAPCPLKARTSYVLSLVERRVHVSSPPLLADFLSFGKEGVGRRRWGEEGGGEGEAANGNGQAEKMRPFTNMDKSQQ